MGKVVLLPFGDREHVDNLLQKLGELVEEGKEEEFALILPSRQLLHQYRNRLVKKASRRLNLVTFDELVTEALAAQPEPIEMISSQVATEILISIIQHKAEELPTISRVRPGDIATELVYALGQLRRGGKIPEDLLALTDRDQVLEEMAFLWRQYEDFLRQKKLADLEEQYLVARSAIPHIPWLTRVGQLHFCWFSDFDSIQLGIIDALIGMGIETTFWLPYDHPAHEQYLGQTLDSLAERGFICEKQDGKGVKGLATSLFLIPPQPISYPVKGLGAQRQEQELELVAEEIKILVTGGAKAEDICLVVPPRGQYQEKLVKVFKEQGIELSLSQSIELNTVPWVRELVKVWRGACSGWETVALMGVLSNVYILDHLPNDYDPRPLAWVLGSHRGVLKGRSLLARIIKERERLVKLTANPENEVQASLVKEKILLYERAGEAARAWLALSEDLASKRCCRDHCRVLLELLQANEARICPPGDSPIAVRDRLALVYLKKLLNEYLACRRLLGGEEQIGADEFLAGLLPWLRQSLPIGRSRPGGVQVLTPAESRGLQFPWVFIVGLNQGVFPWAGQGHWLLERAGVGEVEKTREKEKLYFHNSVALAEKGLFLSRLLPGIEEGAETSAFWREVEIASQSMPLRYLSSGDFLPPIDRAGSTGQVKGRLVYDLVRGIHPPADSLDWLKGEKEYPWLFIAAETIQGREGPRSADNFDGALSSSQSQLEVMFGRATYSASLMEQYGRCPFAFFLRYCLGIVPIGGEEEYSLMERGLLLHWLLEGFYQGGYAKEASSDKPETIVEPLLDIAAKWLEEKGFDGDELVWRLRVEEAVSQVAVLIREDLARQKQTGFKPVLFEAEFGLPGSPVGRVTPGRGIYFRGRIDRIDIRQENDRTLAVVYDYKTSREVTKGKILAGKSLQIPVYIEAATPLLENMGYKRVRVIGGGYYVIKKGKLAGGIWDKEYSQLVKHNLGAVSSQEFSALRENLAQVSYSRHRAISEGNFTPNPEENACRYCDYFECCRYDKYRFQLKGGQRE